MEACGFCFTCIQYFVLENSLAEPLVFACMILCYHDISNSPESVCVCMCGSQTSILSKWLNGLSCFFFGRRDFPQINLQDIQVSPKQWYFPR